MMLTTLLKRDGKKGKDVESVSFKNLVFLCATVTIALLGISIPKQFSKTYLPWHQTPQWERFLRAYDEKSEKGFAHCDSKLIHTQFGQTQVHVCGCAEDPPVVLFHGASMSSIMFANWILPNLVHHNFRAVAVDFPCDNGRSIPADPSRCDSASEDDVANWVRDLIAELGLATAPVSMLGYSYGTTVAFVAALHYPALVDQLVLLSPHATLAPVRYTPFALFRMALGILPDSLHSHIYRWFFRWLAANPESDVWGESNTLKDFTMAAGRVWATHLPIFSNVYNDSTLGDVFHRHETYVGLGEAEVITDVRTAVDRARAAGARVVDVYPKAGHLLPMQCPRLVNDRVLAFLSRPLSE